MTGSSNEADSESAAQPRFSIPPGHEPKTEAVALAGGQALVALVPMLALLIVILAVSTIPETAIVPPKLETRAPSRVISPSRPLVTNQTKSTEPLIRVNVTPGGVDSIQLELRCRWDVVSFPSGEKLLTGLSPGRMTVSAIETGLKFGSQHTVPIQVEIRPEQSPSIVVNGHVYRGKLRLFRRTDGQISAVNVLPIEEYLASVVDSEMPAKFPDAARRAQAIVARTYALYQMQQANPKSVYDLLSSQRSQKYLGVEYLDRTGRRLAGESESSRRVVKATRGTVCQRHGELFCTYYSAVCGGQTTNGDEVFKDASDVVRSVPCDWCRESPHYRWTTQLSRTDFEKALPESGKTTGKPTVIQSIKEHSELGTGQISRFEFHDGKRSRSLNGIELRERLPAGTLFSPHFQIQLEKDRVVFEGRGHGHGVGFCQWGAKGQAESGRNDVDIVRSYFPGADIKVIDY